MNQPKLEVGRKKTLNFILVYMKIWISLPDKTAETRNSHCFKTEFIHIMYGFIHLRISADSKLCYRSLNGAIVQPTKFTCMTLILY